MLGNKIIGYFTLLVEIHLKKKIINGKNIAIFKGGAIYIKKFYTVHSWELYF